MFCGIHALTFSTRMLFDDNNKIFLFPFHSLKSNRYEVNDPNSVSNIIVNREHFTLKTTTNFIQS